MRQWLETERAELAAIMADLGLPGYRAKQVWNWLHGKRAASWEEMTNLPRDLRERLASEGEIRALDELERRDAADGLTSKWLFQAPGESSLVESVLIVEKTGSRRTVCASSMVGCPLGCLFCATGQGGYVRDLTAGEMVEQVYRLDAWSRERVEGQGVSHVVFMGMGEPLLNLDAVAKAAAVLADGEGLGLSGRHLTISTAGVPDGIRRLAGMGVNYRLALSLHAPNQRIRERLMPSAARWPLSELFPALREYAKTASRDMTFEYCLIDGVNASAGDARELVELVKGFRCKINLIPMNPVADLDFRPPSPRAVRRFQEILDNAGIPVTVRMEKGSEIGAACGQLRAER